MSKAIWLGASVGLLVVGALGAGVWWSDKTSLAGVAPFPPVTKAEPASLPVLLKSQAATTPPNTAPNAVSEAMVDPMPWVLPPAAVTGRDVVAQRLAATPLPIGKPGAPGLNDIHQRLQSLVANGRQPSPRELEAVLADLQRNQGNVINGVNIQDMRDNLIRVDRIQMLTQEMQAIAANPRKESLPRIHEISAELQRLNAAMVVPPLPGVVK